MREFTVDGTDDDTNDTTHGSEDVHTPDDLAALDVPSSTGERGELGEALGARVLTDLHGHDLVNQHSPGAVPQGTDLVSIDRDGRIIVSEVKTTAAQKWSPPSTTQNVGDHQMDRHWSAAALHRDGIDIDDPHAAFGDDVDQVGRQLIQIDVPSRTASVWDLDDDGRVTDRSPSETWSLDDLEHD